MRRLLNIAGVLLFLNVATTLAEGLSSLEKSSFSQVLQIQKAWVKLAPSNASVNAAYLELQNPSSSSVAITEVTADCCGHVMLHETQIDGDKVTMHHLDELSVPAKSLVSMLPGGLHLMLMQIKTPLTIGAKVGLILTFADGRQQQVEATVRRDE